MPAGASSRFVARSAISASRDEGKPNNFALVGFQTLRKQPLQFSSSIVIMGWMNRKSHPGARDNIIAVQIDWSNTKDAPSVDFVEDTNDPKSFKQVPIETPDDGLPFIDKSIVIAADKIDLLWVVIDDIVYDCTDFVEEHPGGSRVLESFRSGNCSWQFWRFHGEKDLQEFGRPLRVGQTKGIENKFKEPPRFVGLRKLWGDD